MDAPVWKCQSDLPVVASNAIRFPSPVARKTSPLAVARTPAPIEMRKSRVFPLYGAGGGIDGQQAAFGGFA